MRQKVDLDLVVLHCTLDAYIVFYIETDARPFRPFDHPFVHDANE